MFAIKCLLAFLLLAPVLVFSSPIDDHPSPSSPSSSSIDPSSSDPSAPSFTVADLPESIRRSRVKQLIELLDEKGGVCEDCREKSDLLEKVASVYHRPSLPADQRPSAKKSKPRKSEEKVEKLDEKLFEPEPESSSPWNGAEEDDPFANLPPDIRSAFQKKQNEEDEIIKKLRAAGINVDPSQLNGGFNAFRPKNTKKSKGGKKSDKRDAGKKKKAARKEKSPMTEENHPAEESSHAGTNHDEL